jgi:hypothetical protein
MKISESCVTVLHTHPMHYVSYVKKYSTVIHHKSPIIRFVNSKVLVTKLSVKNAFNS